MAKKRGHYCHVCGNYLPNEKFSGKGHAKHICKKCSNSPKKEQIEEIEEPVQKDIDRIYSLFEESNLSKQNRLYLEHYSESKDLEISNAATGMLIYFSKEYRKINTYEEHEAFLQKYFPNLNKKEYFSDINDNVLFEEYDFSEINDDDIFSY